MPHGNRRSKKTFTVSFGNNVIHSLIFAAGALAGYTYYDQNKEPQIIQSSHNTRLQPCFTPHYKCLPLILHAIADARRSIHMMAYSFTSESIAAALITAKKRGIDVQIILDKSQTDHHSQRQTLQRADIPVYIDESVAIAHNKVIIIDQETVLTGSYNYSVGAENRNAENIIIIKNPDLAQSYLSNWYDRQRESIPLKLYHTLDTNSEQPPLIKLEF